MTENRLRSLTDTVVVVTGAGAGIGAALTEQLLVAGARVVAGELRPELLDPVVQRWGADRIVVGGGDIGDPATAGALIATGVATWGRVDSVVANAGVGFFGGLLDYSVEQTALMVNTNLLGTIWLARAAVERYRAQGAGGDIVITASVAGLGYGSGQESVYAATKAAQLQFATSLDREVRREGIRVSVVAPAAVNTGFAVATGRFGDTPFEEGPFMRPADIAYALLTCLRQPRALRTGLWQLQALIEEI